MKLKWYGTAALLVFDEQSVIAFDPFLGIGHGDSYPERISMNGVGALMLVSDVFVTHGHFDHIIQIPALYSGGEVTIHATSTPCETLRNHGVSEKQLDILSPGGYYAVGNFTVHAIQGRHCQFDKPLVIRTTAAGAMQQGIPRKRRNALLRAAMRRQKIADHGQHGIGR